ncbi:DUF424 domain-containing protein [Fervidicoccus fontis]|uniref:DUF424 family protein n=1 Tax=Fervidicoccus fontis TaxID=683846 RepID=A0A7C2VAK4_9CREN|nr:DUF424 family protein [Fervidicoccus fontis]PMB76303.1 MAG: DUF424 domain-containing protein [Fervidicoccus fontis]HEW63780.1 DUF424 family protein [Fervidicoccus fontis]
MECKGFSLKVFYNERRKFVLVCDFELLGKKFVEGHYILDVSREYYEGECANEEEVAVQIKDADYVSLIGDQSVKLGINEGLVHKDAIVKVQGIPFAIFINTLT